jgi:hypothetical protein
MTVKKNLVTKQEQLAIETAESIIAVGTAQASIDENCQALHKMLKGVKLGTVKSGCAVMIRFTETLASHGKAEQTIKNYATAFRRAVNEGVAFSMNAYRDSKKKGANTTKSEDGKDSVVKLTVAKDVSVEDFAKGLRDVLEGKREQYAELVAFLIDAIDEFEGN